MLCVGERLRSFAGTSMLPGHGFFSIDGKIGHMKNSNRNTPTGKSKADAKPKNFRDDAKQAEQNKKGTLPGEYPPQEDIMNRRDQQRVGMDVESFSRSVGAENSNLPGEPIVSRPNDILDEPTTLGNIEDVEQPGAKEMEQPVPKDLNLDGDNIEFASGNESDVTQEDLQALGPKDLSMDMGEDEQLLKNRVWPVDMAGKDLDIPGPEGAGDVEDEAIGPEDEENDFYSLGGDRHEDNMEGK
jgi:hypothetical protein